MLKDATYQEKFEMLKVWCEEIIETVKKDLKNEHLKKDRNFCRRYFLGKDPSQLDAKSLSAAYSQDIAEGNVGLAEFIATRWLLRNTDIYGFFEGRIKAINPDFESIEELDEKKSYALVKEASEEYGAEKTYIFSVFNSVVFPKKVYDELRVQAEKGTFQERKEREETKEKLTVADLQKRFDRESKAMKERFEKKLSGLQKKYINDTEALKKQLSELQKKMAEISK